MIARVLGRLLPLALTALLGAALLSMLASDRGPLALIRESVDRADPAEPSGAVP